MQIAKPFPALLMLLALLLALLPALALAAPGALDTGFDPGAGVDGVVYALAVQSDGKVLIAGSFTTVDGVGRNNIARLNADGSLDTSFDPGSGPDFDVFAVAVQGDGKVLIGGYFTTVAGRSRAGIARLNPGGSLDTGFAPGAGVDGGVQAIALQADGKVLIGGYFGSVDGEGRAGIARLNPGGSLDTGFNPGAGTDGDILALAVQGDGKVLLGGLFATVGGQPRNNIARLNPGGALDTGFDPGTGTNGDVYALAVQSDGKVLIGGAFTTCDGVSRSHLARLGANGALDTSFDPATGTNGDVYALAVQGDGKLLIAGSFSLADGAARSNVARLGADGVNDASFDPGAGPDSAIYALALQGDGKLLLGGAFTSVAGVSRGGVARLEGQAALTGNQTITFSALPDRIYGDPSFIISATASSGLPVSFSSLTPAVCAVSGSAVSLGAAGTCAIAADRPAGNGFVAAPRVTQSFVVNRKPLTVAANDATRLAGEPNPALTVRYQGFVNGDSSAVLTGSPSCATPAKASSPAGQYPITCAAGTLAAASYSFRFAPGVLTVRPLYLLYLPAITR